jgi:hypothetical protein
MRPLLRLLATAITLTTAGTAYSQIPSPAAKSPTPPNSPLTVAGANTLSLRESTQILVPGPGTTAAYSLDPQTAEAQIAGDQVRIWGRAPGHAVIVLVYSDFSTSTLNVAVTQAPPILPDRPWSGLNPGDSKGYYEFRFSTDPTEITNTLDYRTNWMQLHFTNTDVPSRNLPGASSTWFPYTFLRFTAKPWRFTLLDEDVNSSPISVNSTLVRGVHAETDRLAFHAGYVSVAGFDSLLLPTQKQMIVGATFSQNVCDKIGIVVLRSTTPCVGFGGPLQIGATLYFIQRTPLSLSPQAAQGGGTGFIRRRARPGSCMRATIDCSGFDYSLDLGYSKGFGGAFTLDKESKKNQLHIVARYRPRLYAASETDSLNGLQSQASWDRSWNRRWGSSLSGSDNHILTTTATQNAEVANALVHSALFGGISISSGASASHFADNQALFPSINRFSVPITISRDGKRFSASIQYSYSLTTHEFSPGQGYEGSLHWSGQHFQWNLAAGLETEALGVDSVFSAFPELNLELTQLGLGTSVNVNELAALLNNRAFLNSLGIAPNATIELLPRDWHGHAGASWNWSRQRLEADFDYNANFFLTNLNTTVLEGIHYRRGLSNSTELIASFTMLESVAPTYRLNPVAEISLHHEVGDRLLPRWRRPYGAISGVVSLQDRGGNRSLASVPILLDGARRAVTDGSGTYTFSNVDPGVHTLEIQFRSSRPFWYTTPSKVSAEPGSVVDFGVVFPSAQIIGYVLDDTGAPLADVAVSIRGPSDERRLTANQKGEFVAPVAQAGTYVIDVSPETVRDGYALDDLKPVSVSLDDGDSKKIIFALPAIRGLSGIVQSYDAAVRAYVPVANAVVSLAELNRQAISDKNGRYLFRNMPAGRFTIAVNGRSYDQIEISASPQLLREDIHLKAAAQAQRGYLSQ